VGHGCTYRQDKVAIQAVQGGLQLLQVMHIL
jgi:hypothetical protein